MTAVMHCLADQEPAIVAEGASARLTEIPPDVMSRQYIFSLHLTITVSIFNFLGCLGET
jgi:hypothetical protein